MPTLIKRKGRAGSGPLASSPQAPVAAPAVEASSEQSPKRIRRFQRPEILLHWAIALPFMVCYLSSAILLVAYTQAPDRAYRPLFAWTHRISGLCLLIFPATVILAHPEAWKLLLRNVRQGWEWSVRDIRWLFLMGLSVMNKRIQLPEQGKFNAGEKLNFMMVMTTCPLFIATGLLIWVPGIAFYSWLAHFFMALVATPLMFGHIFMATTNPATRVGITGMVSGYVDREWARHHYPLWYAENFKDGGAGHGKVATSPTDKEAGPATQAPQG